MSVQKGKIDRKTKNVEEWTEYTVIGIVGSRRRNTQSDFNKVKQTLELVMEDFDLTVDDTMLCSGGCPKGADRFAEEIAKEYGMAILIHYPRWRSHGKIAGLLRNTEIANDSDILIACVAGDRKGGTEDTIKKFDDGVRPIYLVT